MERKHMGSCKRNCTADSFDSIEVKLANPYSLNYNTVLNELKKLTENKQEI
ncbi:hypothetical protein [Treponema vincentii]|uniref:hypothetical protein n=1 Tax=Treponema vincentii TaxID=69710 RepID=UPI003D9368E2